MKITLFSYQEFTVSLDVNEKFDPHRPEKIFIQYKDASEPSLVLHLDAPDWMVFSRIDNLEGLSNLEQNNLFLCLMLVLSNEKYLGGKCLFIVNNKYLPQCYGFEKVADHSVTITPDLTLVCKLFPKQQLLLNYHNNFPLPSGPGITDEKEEEEEKRSTFAPMHF